MKVLWWTWDSYMYRGVEEGLNRNKIVYDKFYYNLQNWEEDEVFCQQLRQVLLAKSYDCVFSINYNPLITGICSELGIRYVSWVYDSPLHIRNLTPLKNSCNEVYFFDRGYVEELQGQGYPVRYHILAGDVASFYHSTGACQYDISMVGNAYATEYNEYMQPLDDKSRGYLEGIMKAQSLVTGGYFLPLLMKDMLLATLNQQYARASEGRVQIEARELEYLLAREITHRQRHTAMTLLGNHYDTHWFTTTPLEEKFNIVFHMPVSYYDGMAEIFGSTRINLNISLATIRTGIPLRVFDVLSAGGFLLSNAQLELEEYFHVGEELVVYHDMEELYYQADYYLKHEDLRQRIAYQGNQRVRTDYGFARAIRDIL